MTYEIWEVIGVVTTVFVVLGGIMLAALKSVFMTKKEFKETCQGCHVDKASDLSKIEEDIAFVKDRVCIDREYNHVKDMWLSDVLVRLGGKMNFEVPPMPRKDNMK